MKLTDGTYHLDIVGDPPQGLSATVTGDTCDTTMWGAFAWSEELGCYVSLLPPERHLYFGTNFVFAMMGAPPPPEPVVGTWS